MIVYNVTTKVDDAIKNDWLTWLKEEHIPAIINTGCFTHAHTYRLLEQDDIGGPTFTAQYFAESKSLYNLYLHKFAQQIRNKAYDKWGNQFISFNSVMYEVE